MAADFPWCGLLISCVSLAVSVDYSRYGGHRESIPPLSQTHLTWPADIADTLAIAKGRKSGSEFQLRMLRYEAHQYPNSHIL